MSILFINASPNKKGMTVKWGEKILEDIEYRVLHLVDYSVNQLGQVTKEDEFEQVIEVIKEADILVIGTPIYWWDVTGLLKTFIDRWTDLFQYGLDTPEAPLYQKSVFWFVQGSAPEEAISGIERMLSNVSERFLMEELGLIYQKKKISSFNEMFKQMR
ncbi:flavodoxin family protein [Enterococcus mundtii]|uniref:flavodoxin family protein n=1 Tax=Enterococcus mundtii TaxID=53346 RepID=UPI0002D3ACCB|nr:flavodoxin family protein [Enterococcus mundtii]PTO39237.1 flavodoxin family protein [Enterococcus mundtii]PTO41196.1 flavodoxin family protein [Enterococcus mundtii]